MVTKAIFIIFGVIGFLQPVWAVDFEARNEELAIRVQFEKNPIRVGSNPLVVKVFDLQGNVVQDASVRVLYSMPPMPGMPPMRYKTRARRADGNDFRTNLDLVMGGKWDLKITVKADGGRYIKVKTAVHVQEE